MENSRLIEILELVREKLIYGQETYQTGICKVVLSMMAHQEITIEEKYFISDYLNANKPNQSNNYARFVTNIYWIDCLYWWLPIDKYPFTKQIRIDYLTELINNIK